MGERELSVALLHLFHPSPPSSPPQHTHTNTHTHTWNILLNLWLYLTLKFLQKVHSALPSCFTFSQFPFPLKAPFVHFLSYIFRQPLSSEHIMHVSHLNSFKEQCLHKITSMLWESEYRWSTNFELEIIVKRSWTIC